MVTSIEQRILSSNKQYASEYKSGDLQLQPVRKTTIVTCMDARVDPIAAFGLSLGEVNIIRNAGGSALDALRSILLSNHILGTEEVMVIKHTKCGLLGATNDMARDIVRKNLHVSYNEMLDGFDFIPVKDLEESAKDDVEFLRNHELSLKKVKFTGWILDITTGSIKKVC